MIEKIDAVFTWVMEMILIGCQENQNFYDKPEKSKIKKLILRVDFLIMMNLNIL